MKKTLVLTILLVILIVWPASLVGAEEQPPGGEPVTIMVHKFNDANRNGVQDLGEPDIEGWMIRLYRWDSTGLNMVAEGYTGPDGTITFSGLVATEYKVWEEKLECWEPTTPENLRFWSHDPEQHEGYYTLLFLHPGQTGAVDFGNVNTCEPPPPAPGTGTPGYWKNHPDAWPMEEITIGGVVYTKDEAIQIMQEPEKGDKTKTLFRALVAAKLNVAIDNDDSCVADTIVAADEWMAAYGPAGSGVKGGGKDSPWRDGEPLYEVLDAYNNGELCAPSRDSAE
jgi:hypothetical protein